MDASTYKELICPVGGNYCWPFDRNFTSQLDSGAYNLIQGISVDPNIWGRWLFNAKKLVTTFTYQDFYGISTSSITVYRANPEYTAVYFQDGEEEWEIYRIVGIWDKTLPPALTSHGYHWQNQTFRLGVEYPLFSYEDTDPYYDPADWNNFAYFPYLYYSNGQFKVSSKSGYNVTSKSITAFNEDYLSLTYSWNNQGPGDPGNDPNYTPIATRSITVNLVETFF